MILVHGDNYDEIIPLYDYFPWWHGKNPNFDRVSGRILDVKNKKKEGIQWFVDKLLPRLTQERFAIVTIPQSSKGYCQNGISKVAQSLVKMKKNKIDATMCLYRYKTVPKSHVKGGRSIEKHLNSIKVDKPYLIKDMFVLLLDDVTTSGSTLLACKKLLVQAGAINVQCMALGKTNNKKIEPYTVEVSFEDDDDDDLPF